MRQAAGRRELQSHRRQLSVVAGVRVPAQVQMKEFVAKAAPPTTRDASCAAEMRSRTAGSHLLLSLLPFPQTDPGAAAILVDELDAGRL
jgi:hypothetical protein